MVPSEINPFYATDLFQCPFRTSENQSFSNVLRGYSKRPVALSGLIVFEFSNFLENKH